MSLPLWCRLISGGSVSWHQTIGEFMSNSLFWKKDAGWNQRSHLFFIRADQPRQQGEMRGWIYCSVKRNYRECENERLHCMCVCVTHLTPLLFKNTHIYALIQLAGVKHGRRDIIRHWDVSPGHLWHRFTRTTGEKDFNIDAGHKKKKDCHNESLENWTQTLKETLRNIQQIYKRAQVLVKNQPVPVLKSHPLGLGGKKGVGLTCSPAPRARRAPWNTL